MASAAVLQPQAVHAHMGYHLPVERGGAEVWCPGTVQDKRRPHEYVECEVKNARENISDYSLDVNGFEWGPFSSSITAEDFEKKSERIAGLYYDDVVAHVKKATGASKVVPVVHIARLQPYEAVLEREKDLPGDAPVTAPSYNRSVHIDQSYRGAVMVLENKLRNAGFPDEDVQKLKKSRWAIINLWRPLNEVTRDPLAVCDARTADEEDLTPLFAELPASLTGSKNGYNFAAGSKSEAWEVKSNPKHQWYYASNMTPDECLLIKQYDSKMHGVARRTPHTAISTKEDYGPTRLSVEVRCLTFWEDQPQE